MNRSDLTNIAARIENLKLTDRKPDELIKVSDYNRLIEVLSSQLKNLSGRID